MKLKDFYYKEVIEYDYGDGENTTIESVDITGPEGGIEINRFYTVYGKDKKGLSTAIFDTLDNGKDARQHCIMVCYLLNKETI